MKIFKLAVIPIIFLLMGEFIIRLNLIYRPFDKNNDILIESKIVESEVFSQLKAKKFTVDKNDYRVMILGDSYIHGGGIAYQDAVAQKVKANLDDHNNSCKTIHVLDLSRPGHNTADNYNVYTQFVSSYQPDTVLLGYVLRDVLGPMTKAQKIEGNTKVLTNDNSEMVEKINKDTGIYKFINPLRRHSRLFKYTNTNLQRYLKTKGIVLPIFGSFYQVVNRSYLPQSEAWKQSKKMLAEINDRSRLANSHFLVYYIPEMNVLEHGHLYDKPNAIIDSFFTSLPNIHYFNGLTGDFSNIQSSEGFYISEYDGHPNEAAHEKIANTISRTIMADWNCS